MSYHKSNREKYILNETGLKGATIKMVISFFQEMFKQKKLDSMLEHQELERIKGHALQEALDAVCHKICDALDAHCTHRAQMSSRSTAYKAAIACTHVVIAPIDINSLMMITMTTLVVITAAPQSTTIMKGGITTTDITVLNATISRIGG
jgi:hypothetical protein